MFLFIDPENINQIKDQIQFNSIDGESFVIEKRNIELLYIDGKKSDANKLDFSIIGTWSPFSYNLILTYENGTLLSIKKYVLDTK